MTLQRWQVYSVVAVGIFALGLGTGLGVGAKHDAKKADKAQTQADQAEGAAKTHAAEAATTHQQTQTASIRADQADLKVAHAKQVLESLPVLPEAKVAPETELVIQKQASLISAQDEEIKALKLKASLAEAEANQWHAAYNESQKALALKDIEMQARLAAQQKKGWLHIGESLAIGFGVGRLTH